MSEEEVRLTDHYYTKSEINNKMRNDVDLNNSNYIATSKAVYDAYRGANSQTDEKLDYITAGINNQINNLEDDINQKAIKYHRSQNDDYGIGNAGYYGHLKLSDSISSGSGVDSGVAATPYAVKRAYDKGDNVNTRLTTIKNNIKQGSHDWESINMNSTDFKEFSGSYIIVRNGWCFVNIYAKINDGKHFTPPIYLCTMNDNVGPQTDFLEGAAQVSAIDTTQYVGGHSASRYHGTIQIVKTNSNQNFPYEVKFYSNIDFFGNDLIFGTIAYPIKKYNYNLE